MIRYWMAIKTCWMSKFILRKSSFFDHMNKDLLSICEINRHLTKIGNSRDPRVPAISRITHSIICECKNFSSLRRSVLKRFLVDTNRLLLLQLLGNVALIISMFRWFSTLYHTSTRYYQFTYFCRLFVTMLLRIVFLVEH